MNMNSDEWQEWIGFISKIVVEYLLVAAWVILAWLLHNRLARSFPLEGMPKLTFYLLEFVFYASTLYHLLRLLFWPRRKSPAPRWWQ